MNMFNKKEGFKYETEVNALIRIATENLNQRILALEIQNNQLIINNQRLEGELVQLKNWVYNDFQRLEKRITDFTDVWHPFMMDNINRIKSDLEKTIIETERKDIKNIQEELESKLKKIVEDNNEHVLIGYKNYQNIPIFMPKNFAKDYDGNILYAISIYNRDLCDTKIIIDNLEKLTSISIFDLKIGSNTTFIDKYNNIIRERYPIDTINPNDKSLKVIKKYCDKFNIKIVFGESEYYNGILISNLIN
jgi:hypothetical protein